MGALVMTINSNLSPQIHEAQVEALKKENVKNENLHVVPMTRHGSKHRHLYQQVLEVFKDKGRLSEAIRFTGITGNTPLEMGKYSHGFYHKPAKDNKLLLHDLGNRNHQKDYADVRRKPLEFQVGGISVEKSDTFWKAGKAKPCYIGPFKILAKVITVAYRLELPEQLSRVYSTFHVSNLKKCLSNKILVTLLDEIQINDKPHFIVESVKIMDREVKHLKKSGIPIVKVCWNSRIGPEFT
ncbi:hypothetical protein Tco_1183567 [Tanacetum coccineum]